MTGSGSSGRGAAEQHLGDRLAALVDGELGHEARERVLAHLATCRKCKAEADAQRQLKSFFAQVAPPPPSEGLLARLQGLPGGGADGPEGPFGGPGGPFDRDILGARPDAFGRLPEGGSRSVAIDRSRPSGFRFHDMDRPSSRSRRFAFAAAGAVSAAAFALGGALPLEAAIDTPNGRVDGAATPLRTGPATGGRAVNGHGAQAAPAGEAPAFLSGGRSGTAGPSLTGYPRPPLRAHPVVPPAHTALSPLIRQALLLSHGSPPAAPA
ncbi:anti-sigma factor family protein, partial [Streptomyces sp. URMC 123]|uniref:anti-sigma factor family protein n=1 Tax=Streptomyces sp. URMC 123 TaxID=3423403 RepID=UPI003F1C8499